MTTKKTPKSWKYIFLNVFEMLVWVLASIIVVQRVVGYLALWCLGQERLAQPIWLTVTSTLSYILIALLVILVPRKILKKNPQSSSERTILGFRGLPTWTDIGLAPVGYMVSLVLAMGLTALFELFPWFDAEQAQELGFSTYIVGFDRIIAFIALVVVAPIAEEVIFRGWLYGKMREKISEKASELWSIVISICLVSLLFGIVHGQWNVGVDVFALSVVLCGLREITGTIYSGILLHMLKNGLAFYLLFIVGIR